MKQDSDFLGTQPVGRLMCKLALPSVVAQLVNLLYNMVDRIYIGHYDESGLALTGVGVCLPVIMLISAFAALVGMGGAPRASILMGKKEVPTAERVMGTCFVFLIGVGVVLTAVFLGWGRPLLMAFGASENTIGAAWDYLSIYVAGTLFVQLALGMNAFITAQGFTMMSMMSVLIGAALNIVLDPILIFGLGMGVRGAALATIVSQAVSAVWVVAFLCGKKTQLRLRPRTMRPDFKLLWPCLALGVSPFIMQATESVISVCFNTSLLRYGGDIAVGSMTVMSTLMQFCMLPLQGLTQGAQPITSYNFGAHHFDRVRAAFRVLLRSCLVYSVLLWAAVMLCPQLFIQLFNNNPELIAYASWAMRIYFAVMGIFGIQLACQQTLISIGNAKTSLFLAVLRKILLLIPLIYLLPMLFADKAMAVFLAEPVADAIAVTTTALLFRSQFRKALQEPESQPQEQDGIQISR